MPAANRLSHGTALKVLLLTLSICWEELGDGDAGGQPEMLRVQGSGGFG
jgi:hypothetical protein